MQTVVHSPASSKYISVVLCVFLMPVIIFFKKLLFSRPVRSTPIFAKKSLGLHRRYLRFSQQRGSHRATHRLPLSKSLKAHIPSVYTVIGLFYKNHYKCRRKKAVGVRRSFEFSPLYLFAIDSTFTLSYKIYSIFFCIKVWYKSSC